MATRSVIGIRENDGQITQIYCHWDGYPSNHWPLLTQHYAIEHKVRQLMSYGDRSALDAKPESGLFQNGSKARTDADWIDYGQEYEYLFENGTWYYRPVPLRGEKPPFTTYQADE